MAMLGRVDQVSREAMPEFERKRSSQMMRMTEG
jgi:hypothetical protein